MQRSLDSPWNVGKPTAASRQPASHCPGLGLRPRLTAADRCPLECPWSPRAPSPPPSKVTPQEGSQWKAPDSAQTFLVLSVKEEGSVQFPARQPDGTVNHRIKGDVSIRPLPGVVSFSVSVASAVKWDGSTASQGLP
ncbi:unnamed protein product [Rangifer tarandus platyrhynchus]|uniref:Uncharacterized protein n=1 Tax=Rangifer tarandus platyrhynchus TaxID=3082113 RepID=A0AC59YQL6_RANTA